MSYYFGDALREERQLDSIERSGRGDECWDACCYFIGTQRCRCHEYGTTRAAKAGDLR